MNRLEMIKAAAEKAQAKRKEEADFQASIVKLDARKAAIKEEMKLHKKTYCGSQKGWPRSSRILGVQFTRKHVLFRKRYC